MQTERATSLVTEQSFGTHEAFLGTLRNFVSCAISLVLTAGIVGPFVWGVVDSYGSTSNWSQIIRLFSYFITVAILLTFTFFPSCLNVLGNRVIRQPRFANLSERWLSVYDHLFAIGHLDAATEVKYDPFSYNGSFIKNEAQALVQTLKTLSQEEGAKAPQRLKPAGDGASSNARALALLESYTKETKSKQAGRRFIVGVAPFF